MTAMIETPEDTSTETFAARVFGASLAFMDTLAICIGDQLGWYDALAAHGPMTSDDLAAATSTDATRCRRATPRCSPTVTAWRTWRRSRA
jgi:hypothetical protein